MTVVPPLGAGLSHCRSPAFYGRKGDHHDALASLALQFQALSAHFGNQLSAFTARFESRTRLRRRRFCTCHGAQDIFREIENDY